MDATPSDRVRAGGDTLLRWLPPREADRQVAAAQKGEVHAERWRRHVDGTGGDLLWVDPGPPLLVAMNSHNMAFYVWEEALRRGRIRPGAHAVHVDFHPDFFEPLEPLPPPGDAEESLTLSRRLRWNDWQTAAFARGVIDRITDVSQGDVEDHLPPYVAASAAGGMRYLEAGRSLGDPHGLLLRVDLPLAGTYRLRRGDGLTGETLVVFRPGVANAPPDTLAGLRLAQRVSAEGKRLTVRALPDGEVLVRLPEGPGWLLAVSPGDESRVPPALELRFDPDATEADGGGPVRRLDHRWSTLPAICEEPPEPTAGGLLLDVDLDWLNVHREGPRPDPETITEECVERFVVDVRRAVPSPDVVTIALSPECLAPRITQEDLEEVGISLPGLPPEDLGMREGRRRLALFLRAWRR